MRKQNIGCMLASVVGVVSWATTSAWAGNDLYFVTYNSHISKGELELMIMNDFTAPSPVRREDDGQHNYFSNMIEIEYGITEQFASELMFEAFEEVTTGEAKFTGFRWENRYRLFRNEVPLNPMVYLEYEDLDPATRYKMEVSGWVRPPYQESGAEPDRERILESRLILSQDFGPLNVAFNWINESDLNESGSTAFGYALGLRYELNQGHYARDAEEEGPEHAGHHEDTREAEHEAGVVALGLELYGALGDMQKLAVWPSRQEHYLQPALMTHLGEHVMLHLGVAIGLSNASDDLVRTGLAIEF